MTSSRTTLAVGEYDGGQVVELVRRHFLSQVRKRVPRVLEELSEETLDLFRRALLDAPTDIKPPAFIRRLKLAELTLDSSELSSLQRDVENGRYASDKNYSLFLVSLLEWSKRWNLTADWCLFFALKTLNSWHGKRPALQALDWRYLLFGLDDPKAEPSPPEGFPAWNVFEDSRSMYRRRVFALAKNALNADHILKHIEASQRAGFVNKLKPVLDEYQERVAAFYRTQKYPQINRREVMKHIEWTVDFQVGGHSFKEIAGRDVAEQAVNKAGQAILKLINLDKRPSRAAGRPLGSQDRGHRHIVRRKRVR